MQCVVLAGGLGTRISAVAGPWPKTLIPVAGQPFAIHQLRWLRSQGVSDVLYCIGHRGAMIRDLVGDGSAFGVSVTYCDEGEPLRGTGGAIRLAHDVNLLGERFLVLYGDSYLPIDIAPVLRTSGSGEHPTMVVLENRGRWDASNVVFKNGHVQRYEKNVADPAAAGMFYIDYGLSVLNRRIIADRIPAGHRFDLATLYAELSRDGVLHGHEVTTRFYEIGSPAGLAELEGFLSAHHGPVDHSIERR